VDKFLAAFSKLKFGTAVAFNNLFSKTTR